MRGVRNNRGQVTVFIIIALVIVVAGVLIYMFMPGLKDSVGGFEDNPKAYIQDCLEDEFQENIDTISKNGGTIQPEHFVSNYGQEIEYLCYTPDYLVPCVVERPLLVTWIQNELKEGVSEKVESCFDSLEENYKKKGYDVSINRKGYEVILTPNEAKIDLDYEMVYSKQSTKNIDSFSVVLDNNIYELISIAYNILNWEATYGDANVDVYMDFNPSLIIDKQKKDDGTKIYIIKDIKTNQMFQFASRSIVWSPAYNLK